MRLSDRERERCFDELARQAAAGRLDVAELERRVVVLERATTREEAMDAFADLPSSPFGPAGAAAVAAGDDAAERGRPRRGRGHGEAEAPHPDWRATPERFRDPRSGRIMRVWVDGTGARHYVPDG